MPQARDATERDSRTAARRVVRKERRLLLPHTPEKPNRRSVPDEKLSLENGPSACVLWCAEREPSARAARVPRSALDGLKGGAGVRTACSRRPGSTLGGGYGR